MSEPTTEPIDVIENIDIANGGRLAATQKRLLTIEQNLVQVDQTLQMLSENQDVMLMRYRNYIRQLNDELEAKEQVIRYLRPYRWTSPHFYVTKLINVISPRVPFLHRLYHATVTHTQMRLSPRLGDFFHYAARPLEIPGTYYRTPLKCDPVPRISIVTPSFNQGQFIGRTLHSVIDQGYPNLEYIVQDGGSKDETQAIVELYRPALASAEFKRDKGQANGINIGFGKSTGEIMAYLNSDDLLLPGSLNYVADYFARHPEVDAVYGHRIIVDENDDEVGRWVMPPHDSNVLTWVDYVPQETLFWRRSLWERSGAQLDESFRFALDWDLLLRFRAAGANMVRLPRFLGAFRVHSAQKTSAQISSVGDKEMWKLRERELGRPTNHIEVNANIRRYMRQHVYYQKLYRLGVFRY